MGEDLVTLQNTQDVGIVILVGDIEGGFVGFVLGVLVRTRLKQCLHDLGVDIEAGTDERGVAPVVRDLHDLRARARAQKRLHEIVFADLDA